MSLCFYANSQAFFENPSETSQFCSNTLKDRWSCSKDYLKKMAVLPLALLVKAGRTFFRIGGIVLAACFLMATLAASHSARKFFLDRMMILAKDLADWVLYPFSLLVCTIKLFLAWTIHPDLYFN